MTLTTQRVPGQLPGFPGAVINSGLIFTSGIVDELDLQGRPRSSAEQVQGALDALVGTIERARGNAGSILRIEAYLSSPDQLPIWGAAFTKRWPTDAPARTTLITQLALPTLTVEIQAVAVVDDCDR